MYLVDSHTHVYLPEFDGDRPALMERALAAQVQTLLMPAIDSSTHEKLLQVEQEFPFCRSMIGLHPCSVREDFEKELDLVQTYLGNRKFIAIGEIGLDFYWDKTYTAQQFQAFERQIQMALEQELPISIHSRSATAECIEVVRRYPGLRGV